jgi:hypothetical protein
VFLRWCEGQGIIRLQNVKPVHVATYVEQLAREMSPPSVKQHLACIGNHNGDTGFRGHDNLIFFTPSCCCIMEGK